MLVGNLKDQPLPQLLYKLYTEKQTGTLIIRLNELRKAILFDNGQIISAYSSAREDSLGEVLLRSGRLTVEDYLEVASHVKKGHRFSQVLLDTSKISPSELNTQWSYQVLSIIYTLFLWQIGHFEFTNQDLSEKELPNLDISTLDIILRGVKLIRSWEQIHKVIDSLDDELERFANWRATIKQLQLSRDEQAIFHSIESGVSVRDIIMLSNLNSFETCRLLMGYLVIELVKKRSMPSWIVPDNL